MTDSPTRALYEAGVSTWLDDLSRQRLVSGNLERLIEYSGVCGVTTNPTIFAAALSGVAYDRQFADLARAGATPEDAVFELTTTDVASACDLFEDVFRATNGVDGRVSIEVSPLLAHDAQSTVLEARRLRDKVGRENVLVKIPATVAGLRAITDVVSEGISVNVTLIFSLERYESVIDAYIEGLERARAQGHDLSGIHSVASFFVSRVDTEVDRRLKEMSTPDARALRSGAGLANARLAYDMRRRKFASERALSVLSDGAHVQRPLWASTGVKDPALPDTMYVTQLVADGCVNTMPVKTLEAFLHHGVVEGDTITPHVPSAHDYFDRLSAVGVDMADVARVLEREGIEKFVESWQQLLTDVEAVLDESR